MGLITAEQTTAIIESVAEVVEASNPTPVTPEQSYWWWLSLAIVPVVLGWWLNKKKKP